MTIDWSLFAAVPIIAHFKSDIVCYYLLNNIIVANCFLLSIFCGVLYDLTKYGFKGRERNTACFNSSLREFSK